MVSSRFGPGRLPWPVFVFLLAAAVVFLLAPHYASCLNAVSVATLKIKEIGYPLETYSYWTTDEYLLGMERIPYGKHADHGAVRKPVLLVHGLLTSSAVYTINNSSLSFVLSDAGFDVWLFNARGSGLSRSLNIYNNPQSSPNMNSISWNSSFQEMGEYDLTAAIDFILKKTGHLKMDVVSYSMGGAITLVGLSDKPEYNLKINKLVLMAPASRIGSPGALINIIRSQSKLISMIFKRFDFWPPVTDPDTTFKLVKRWCANENNFIFCKWFLILIEGHNVPMTKDSVLNMISIFPQPMSTKTLNHLLQSITSGKFRHFNYGPSENMLQYNRTTPPDYDLSRVTAPTYMFYSKDDTIVGPEDIRWLLTRLPNVKDVNYFDKITIGHLNFAFHSKIKEVVYSKIANELLDVSK